MACFRPIDAWQLDGGEIVFSERGKIRRALRLPCGRCIGCRLVRVRSWAIRCMHESQLHDVSSFITLTYDDDHYSPDLNYRDFQLFMYRARKMFGPTRFFMCGEYGESSLRPHFHALLFGVGFADRVLCGKDLYRSPSLEKLWTSGFSSVGDVTYQSAAYVAQYALKKVNGELADRRYSRVDERTGECVRVVPEFGHMSLKPGIGYGWFQKFWRDVYLARDGVMVHERLVPPPRYYDKLLDALDFDLKEGKDFDRYVRSGKFADDCTPERLMQREICAVSRERSKRKGIL